MSEKKYQKLSKIVDVDQRNACMGKRRKELLRKAVELSVLCQVDVAMFIVDRHNNQATHFGTREEFNVVSSFNAKMHRKFYSN